MLKAAAEDPSSSLGSCLSNACNAHDTSGRNHRHSSLPSISSHSSAQCKGDDLFKADFRATSVIGLS